LKKKKKTEAGKRDRGRGGKQPKAKPRRRSTLDGGVEVCDVISSLGDARGNAPTLADKRENTTNSGR